MAQCACPLGWGCRSHSCGSGESFHEDRCGFGSAAVYVRSDIYTRSVNARIRVQSKKLRVNIYTITLTGLI